MLPVRVARIAIPSVSALALVVGGIVALQPGDAELTAEPAAAGPATPQRQVDRATRDRARPDLDAASRAGRALQTKREAADRKAAARSDRNPRASALSAYDRGAAAGSVYATTAVNLRTRPAGSAAVTATVDARTRLQATKTTVDGWRQVERSGRLVWVLDRYVSTHRPAAPKATATTSATTKQSSRSAGAQKRSTSSGGSTARGVSGGSCPGGSGVESGLQPNAVKVHRAICHAFPQVKSYGGVRADSIPGHPDGRALDSMLPNYSSASGQALGAQIAAYARSHAAELGITEVIYNQRIWTTQRASEGWRSMSNRGSDTANHRDHVHVTVR